MNIRSKIRLFVDTPLGEGQSILLDRDQANYLFNVMRLNIGDNISVFNGKDGEWQADVLHANKRKGILVAKYQSMQQLNPPDLWLLFAPIKKTRTDFIVEKATEMGVSRIFPVNTDYTNSDRIKQSRLQSHSIEAAEQCGGTYVPPVDELSKLTSILKDWPKDRCLIFCDENKVGEAVKTFKSSVGDKWAILIGPEGGFSKNEIKYLKSLEFVTSISLGPRILRADTAVVAALAIWQREIGDWK